MALKRFQPGQPCCCGAIGREGPEETSVVQYCCKGKNYKLIPSIESDNADKIYQCRAIFVGAIGDGKCDTTMDPGVVSDYMYNGGRVFVQGEYATYCDNAKINAFIQQIGGSMTIGTHHRICNCDFKPEWTGNINTSVPMLRDVDAIMHACTNNVDGGTWLATTNSEPGPFGEESCLDPFPFIAMEQVGDGFLIVAGDSNVAGNVYYEINCALWRAFIENPPERML